MKKIMVLLTIFIMIGTTEIIGFAYSEPDIFVNGRPVKEYTLTIKCRTMAPMREIFEMLGYNVQYDSGTHTAIAGTYPSKLPDKRDDGIINVVINNNLMKSDVDPAEIEGITYVPVRFIAETLNLDVNWDEAADAVYIGAPKTDIYTARSISMILKSKNKNSNFNKIIQSKYSDILYAEISGVGTAAYYTLNQDYEKYDFMYLEDIDGEYGYTDKKVTTVDGTNYWGLSQRESFYDYNSAGVSLFGKTYYKNAEGLCLLCTDFGCYTYAQLGLNIISTATDNNRLKIVGSLEHGGYLLLDTFYGDALIAYYGKSSSTNKAIYRVHSPAYFNNAVTYTEHNGNLYYFTCDNTLAWMKRYIYTLYKYSFSDGTTEKVAEFEPIANQLMFSNGQIFEETENGFNIYSLSGKHLRSIVIENAAELPKFKFRYDTDKYGENKYGVENDKGIHESFNGNIYCIINNNQLIELSPLDQ